MSLLWCNIKNCSQFLAQISGEKKMEKKTVKFWLSAVSEICFKLVCNLIEVILTLTAAWNPKSRTEALTSIAPYTV